MVDLLGAPAWHRLGVRPAASSPAALDRRRSGPLSRRASSAATAAASRAAAPLAISSAER